MSKKIELLTEKGKKDLMDFALEHPEMYQNDKINLAPYSTFQMNDVEIKDEYPFPVLDESVPQKDLWRVDYENSLKIYYFFIKNEIPISLMFDERYMALLAHREYFSYMSKRWPITERHNEGRIKSQYFFSRAPYARHGILRLFWPAYLISERSSNLDEFKTKLECFFKNRVALDRILERSFSRNPNLLDACIRSILELGDGSLITGHGRSGILGKQINNILSVTSLDALGDDEAYNIIKKLVQDIANGQYDYKANLKDDIYDYESDNDE